MYQYLFPSLGYTSSQFNDKNKRQIPMVAKNCAGVNKAE
jgi:hypothetical protein